MASAITSAPSTTVSGLNEPRVLPRLPGKQPEQQQDERRPARGDGGREQRQGGAAQVALDGEEREEHDHQRQQVEQQAAGDDVVVGLRRQRGDTGRRGGHPVGRAGDLVADAVDEPRLVGDRRALHADHDARGGGVDRRGVGGQPAVQVLVDRRARLRAGGDVLDEVARQRGEQAQVAEEGVCVLVCAGATVLGAGDAPADALRLMAEADGAVDGDADAAAVWLATAVAAR